jgi:conjugative relaxase-like TrwC/TraI family protein
VQTTHKIEGSSAVRFARYLLAEASRGDYYTHDGQGGKSAPTQWHGPELLLRRFGIDPEKAVEMRHLGPLMQGFDPVTGKPIRPAGSNGTRVAGIDLTFAPPKEVSALWATTDPYRRAQIEVAHRKAVKSALKRIERDVALVRRKTDGVQRFEKAKGLLATEVVHTTSRLGKDQDEHGIPDPQLHSHIVLLAAERKDGVLAAIESKQIYRSARENGAWYRAELAANLQELGIGIERLQGNGERYFGVHGVSKDLSERWSTRTQDVHRAANLFRQRYGREPGPGELDSITLSTRGSKTAALPEQVNAAWRALGGEHNQTAKRSEEAFHDWGLRNDPNIDLAKELLANVTKEASTIDTHELHAKAYELSAGVCRPAEADKLIQDLIQAGELVELEDGTLTTRQLRELEQTTLDVALRSTTEIAAPVSEQALKQARREIGKQIKGSLTQEQREALQTVTGTGGIALMVGHAGTGKGVVLSTAARAWQLTGNEVIGTAVAGATAQRLKDQANLERAYTVDGLIKGIEQGRIRIGAKTVIVFDEAAMADHYRLAPLVQLTAERGARVLLVGDGAQISAIGPGGLFAALEGRVPTAELTEVHRANHAWERKAWEQIRAGEPGPPLAQYQSRDRLHISDTRAEAAEAMVENWDQMRKDQPGNQAVMITDASNLERDQINAMAQERRVQAGELGAHQVELPGKPYSLRAGDEIIFSAKYPVPGQQRVENGTTGIVLHAGRAEDKVTIRTHENEPRELQVDTQEFSELSLAYATHINKGQGITAETSGILIGGWQTDKEHAYVAVSRAREQTQIYVSREDLGEIGLDVGAVERLGEKLKRSRAQEATITRNVAEREQAREPDRHQAAERRQTEQRQPTAHPQPDRHQATEERRQTVEREPQRQYTAGWDRGYEYGIDEFLDSGRGHPRDRPRDDDDFISTRERDQDQRDRGQNDARERFTKHEPQHERGHQPTSAPLDIRHADPEHIQIEVRDLEDIKLAYSSRLYDFGAQTGEPTYVLFGGWQADGQIGFVATVHANGETKTAMSTENREGRDIETELRDRIGQVIERSQSHEPNNAREADRTNARDPDRNHQHEPAALDLGDPTADPPPAIEPLPQDHDTQRDIEPLEPGPDQLPDREREPVERDPYIQEAIDRERDRQQAFEQGIEQDREKDRGFGIE